MKISYRTATVGSNYVLLLDTSAGADIIDQFPPSFRPLVQREQMFGVQTELRRPQGNIVCSLPLKFNQAYNNQAAALQSIRTFAALMDQLIHLKVNQDAETQYYPNAIVESYEPRLEGVSATHTFVFTTDNVTNSPP